MDFILEIITLYLYPPETDGVGPDESARTAQVTSGSIHYAEAIKMVFSRDGSYIKPFSDTENFHELTADDWETMREKEKFITTLFC